MLGFTASAWFRTLLGLGFVVAAVTLVYGVEHPRDAASTPVSAHASAPAATHGVRVVIESTFPVATWNVSADGVVLVATRQDAWQWHGGGDLPSGSEILITATAQTGDQAPHHALRLSLGGAKPQTVWGGGDVTTTVVVP
jgi:hypothetical protein